MEKTLPQLEKALKGLVVMSNELEAMSNSIAVNQVPEMWEKKAYPSMKPLSAWFDDLIMRIEMVENWIEHGIPVVFWISGFYFPQAFLTGSLQNYAQSRNLFPSMNHSHPKLSPNLALRYKFHRPHMPACCIPPLRSDLHELVSAQQGCGNHKANMWTAYLQEWSLTAQAGKPTSSLNEK